MASARRVFEVIDFEEQTPDAADAAVLRAVQGDVEIQNVDFSYRADAPLIENLNLRARPGQRVAIVGPHGLRQDHHHQLADALLTTCAAAKFAWTAIRLWA